MIAEAVPYEDFWFHDGPWTEEDGVYKNHLYSVARIPWYLLVEVDEDDERPTLILQRLGSGHYDEVARAVCGETLQLPDPLGEIDPADLLKRRR
ncbi:hypothetical protein NE235_12400 [Actinoallomurus spadix]|uniref:Restriction endonuclease domain-containing protein n=1 Tax=Actinoallomurus spadix TaxID=79912 RepID=A0ABP3GXB7_9ACTN|nr:hypothetical protein [Actinoallomurus spadix]MCO5986903.1 hypothetical protein [Actinoallomurus spadix]